MSDADTRSDPVIGPDIHRELDRLRALDWTARPERVESRLGTLACDYDEDLGVGGWICLNGAVSAGAPAVTRPTSAPFPPSRPVVRVWIPQPRLR